MHGLINRAIQCYLRDTHGAPFWAAVAREAQLGFDNFEAMLVYDRAQTEAVIAAAEHLLQRPRDGFLEDLGTYLIWHPTSDALRRLLRFGGVTFTDFLLSLEDLPDRARLALPDFDLPKLRLADHSPSEFTLWCGVGIVGAGHVTLGLLRAMADDYGALVVLEHRGRVDGGEAIGIHLSHARHAAGRPFDLTARQG